MNRELKKPTEEQVRERLSFARAGLALADHEVTDPVLLDLLEQCAREEITGEECLAAARKHIQG